MPGAGHVCTGGQRNGAAFGGWTQGVLFFKMREVAVHADGEERLEGEIGYPPGNGKMAGTGSWGR